MKTFNVFYDVVPGVFEEMCLTVHNCSTKSDAVSAYQSNKQPNTIFRCVKAPLF